jgi:hypothetical protein
MRYGIPDQDDTVCQDVHIIPGGDLADTLQEVRQLNVHGIPPLVFPISMDLIHLGEEYEGYRNIPNVINRCASL